MNSKVADSKYLLHMNHVPLYLKKESCIVIMDPNDPTAHDDIPRSSTQVVVELAHTRTDQMSTLFRDIRRIKQGLSNLAKN